MWLFLCLNEGPVHALTFVNTPYSDHSSSHLRQFSSFSNVLPYFHLHTFMISFCSKNYQNSVKDFHFPVRHVKSLEGITPVLTARKKLSKLKNNNSYIHQSTWSQGKCTASQTRDRQVVTGKSQLKWNRRPEVEAHIWNHAEWSFQGSQY